MTQASEARLTEIQKEIVESRGRNLIVSAGAGTGKTRVLVERFLHAVVHDHVPVTEILALTFTEKAANEMKERIRSRLLELGLHGARRDLEAAAISTIHAFASRVLKEHPLEAGVDPDFRVIEEEEAKTLKDLAAADAIEETYAPGSGTFHLLRTYGEERVNEGLRSCLEAARHEGKMLQAFFGGARATFSPLGAPASVGLPLESPLPLLESLGESQLAAEWRVFEKDGSWDWEKLEAFKAWSRYFANRGGKAKGEIWKRISALCKAYVASRIDQLALPWRERWEALALAFESAYERRKREEAALDFDDLQIRALELFRGTTPLHERLRRQLQEKFRHLLVDEFQDTSFLQLELIERLASPGNLFLVGDYRQSIYGFRGAEPLVFRAKEEEYEKTGTGARKVLDENFRSRPAILDFVNPFFEHLWAGDGFSTEPLRARLGGTGELEWLTAAREEGEDLDLARHREARLIARRIAELHEEGTPYGHIAILFQAMTHTALYEQALKRAGVPYFVVAGRTFYQQPEIRDVLQFLAYLVNPLQDIPLAACLRSPLVQVSDDTLFWLARRAKSQDETRPLFESLLTFEDIAEIPEGEKTKLRDFLRISEGLRAERDRLRIAELLDRLLALSSFELAVLADPQGIRQYANLRKLVRLARGFEAHERMDLGGFLARLKALETREVRESEAQVEAEKGGKVVRLLSIHKAKGLEFPVVFIADLACRRQPRHSQDILARSHMGYALRIPNEKTGSLEEPGTWRGIRDAARAKEREEWKRLFYVAATRAQERLILSGVLEKEEEGERESRAGQGGTWMDWLRTSPEEVRGRLKQIRSQEPFPLKPKLPLARKARFEKLFPDLRPRPMEELIKALPKGREVADQGEALIHRMREIAVLPSRTIDLPVTAFWAYRKSADHYLRVYEIGLPDSDWETADSVARWGVEGEVPPADFGTALHAVLERLDFQNPSSHLEALIRDHVGFLGEGAVREAGQILRAFLQGPLFGELREAKAAKRELSFVLNERHGLIHGVIDLLYQSKDGGWHIVDYKTGVGSEEKVSQFGYDLQVEIYAHAVREILGRPPASVALYFLRNQWAYRRRLQEDGMHSLGLKVRGLQEEILNFSAGLSRGG